MSNLITESNSQVAELDDPLQILNNFYRQVVLIKQAIEQGDLEREATQYLKLSRAVTPEEMADFVSLRLQRWLEKKRNDARKLLIEKSYSRINETLFIAAALADELFILEIDWPGRKHWYTVLLEERIFQSCYAGERFYIGATRLLNKRVLDTQERSLLSVYFLSLRLGFLGRYRDQPQRLQFIRQQLFKRINGGLEERQQVVCTQAYEHLLASMQEQRLAPLARWRKKAWQAFFLYLLLGWLAWTMVEGKWVDQSKKTVIEKKIAEKLVNTNSQESTIFTGRFFTIVNDENSRGM